MLTFNEKAAILEATTAPHMESSKALCLRDARNSYAKGQYGLACARLERGADYAFGRSYRPAGWKLTDAQTLVHNSLNTMAPGEVRVIEKVLVCCDHDYKFMVGTSTALHTNDEPKALDVAAIEILQRSAVVA